MQREWDVTRERNAAADRSSLPVTASGTASDEPVLYCAPEWTQLMIQLAPLHRFRSKAYCFSVAVSVFMCITLCILTHVYRSSLV